MVGVGTREVFISSRVWIGAESGMGWDGMKWDIGRLGI